MPIVDSTGWKENVFRSFSIYRRSWSGWWGRYNGIEWRRWRCLFHWYPAAFQETPNYEGIDRTDRASSCRHQNWLRWGNAFLRFVNISGLFYIPHKGSVTKQRCQLHFKQIFVLAAGKTNWAVMCLMFFWFWYVPMTCAILIKARWRSLKSYMLDQQWWFAIIISINYMTSLLQLKTLTCTCRKSAVPEVKMLELPT